MNVKIEITPYNALTILSFCREFINDDNKDNYMFKAIHEAVQQFENQVYEKIDDTMFEDAMQENQVNQLIGKSPKRN